MIIVLQRYTGQTDGQRDRHATQAGRQRDSRQREHCDN